MSSICRAVLRFLLSALLIAHLISAGPLIVVRRAATPYLQTLEQLERLIDEEQASRQSENVNQVLQRHRKSIPDGYFNEFTVNTDLHERQRRGQPISDYTDEFSADPFEVRRFARRSASAPR